VQVEPCLWHYFLQKLSALRFGWFKKTATEEHEKISRKAQRIRTELGGFAT
jgi:hypothetical protein